MFMVWRGFIYFKGKSDIAVRNKKMSAKEILQQKVSRQMVNFMTRHFTKLPAWNLWLHTTNWTPVYFRSRILLPELPRRPVLILPVLERNVKTPENVLNRRWSQKNWCYSENIIRPSANRKFEIVSTRGRARVLENCYPEWGTCTTSCGCSNGQKKFMGGIWMK